MKEIGLYLCNLLGLMVLNISLYLLTIFQSGRKQRVLQHTSHSQMAYVNTIILPSKIPWY